MGETPVGAESQFVHLLGRNRGQITATVAEVGAEQAGEPVQVFVALGVPDVTAFTSFDYEQVVALPSIATRKMRHQVGPGLGSNLGQMIPPSKSVTC